MFGLNLWKTRNAFINLGELTEAKDTFPIGTIKKYGKNHLYVKVGGDKKPWVYYATLGSEKSDAAIKAGGVIVVNGKAVAPATQDNLDKHGQKHPHDGGTPPPIELGAEPPSGPVAAGGVVSAVPVVAPKTAKKSKKAAPPEAPDLYDLTGVPKPEATGKITDATWKEIIQDVAKAMKSHMGLSGTGSLDLDALFAAHPYLPAKIAERYGVDAKEVAFLAARLQDTGAEKTLQGYKDLPQDHMVHKALKKIAADMGIVLPTEPAPPPPDPALMKAHELSKQADDLSAVAKTPEEHDAAVKAHMAAHNAYVAVNADATLAAHHEAEMLAQIAAKKDKLAAAAAELAAKVAKKEIEGWTSFPDPATAKAKIGDFVKGMDKDPGYAAGSGLVHTYGADYKKTYQLAKSVQTMSVQPGSTEPDPEGLLKHAEKFPTMADKLVQLYGPDWAEKAKAIGLALQAQGALTPPPPAAAPPPPPPPTPKIQAVAGAMSAGGSPLVALDKLVAQHPELKQKLADLTGMHYKDAAFLAQQMVSAGVANTLAGYKDLPPDHVVHKAIKALAGEMGMSMPAPPPAPPPIAAPPSSGTLSGFLQSLKDIPDGWSPDKGNKLGDLAHKINITGGGLTGYHSPEGKSTQPMEVMTVAHSLAHKGLPKTKADYGHLMSDEDITKLWGALGQPGPATASSPPPPPTATPQATSHNIDVHVPKKGEAFQAIQKLGYGLDSDEAKTVALLHTFGDYDKVMEKLKGFNLTDTEAEKLLNKVVQDGPKVGAFAWNADDGYPTFVKKPKKPKPAGALSAYADKIKNGTDIEIEALVNDISPGFFSGLQTASGSPLPPVVAMHTAQQIAKWGLKKATEKNTVVATASMKKIAAALKPAEAEASPAGTGTVIKPSMAPPPPSAVPSELPKLSDLKLKGDAKHLGGAGQKAIYVDHQGKEYLFKVAKSKSGDKVEPYRAEVQAAFSAFARKVKPNHPPIGVVTMNGQLGTIYPFVAAKGNLASVAPGSLTDTEKFDVAAEHVLDWLGSQHDSHGANLLRTDDGRVVGLDKEQGFKYFPNDKLDVDYHPNSKYGENEPYYNKFWRSWSEGKVDFDPKALGDVIDKAMAVPGKTYEDTLRPYAAAKFPGDAAGQAAFLRRAVNRKNTLKRDYEKFLTQLYEKKNGTPGAFTFAAGWVPKSKADEPYEKTVIVTPEKHIPEKVVPDTTHTAASMLAALPGTGKTAEYTPKGATSPDPTKITVKTSAGEGPLKDMLKKMGFGDVDTKVGGHYTMAFVDKAKWDAYKETVPGHTVPAQTIPAVTKKEMVYPGKDIASHSGQPTYFPAMRVSEPTKGNVALLGEIKKDTKLKWQGTRITLDGPGVEQQVARVYRKKDAKGEYYEVHFKLRAPVAKKITGGTSTSFSFPTGQYDAATDTQVDDANQPYGNTELSVKKFETSHGEAIFVPPSSSQFAFQGGVYARIRTGPENIKQGLAAVLEKMQPGLSAEVLKDPTPEEREVALLSSALKAVAPQVADELDANESSGKTKRTSEVVRQKLSGYMTDEEMSQLSQVEILPNHAGAVLPGRWRKLGGTTDPSDPNVRFLMWEVSTPDKVVNMLKGNGPASIHDRALQGLKIGSGDGASIASDISSGCADNITMRVVTKAEDHSELGQGWGDIRLIFAPDELDRLDPFFHHGDQYGCTNPNDSSHGSAFKNRKTLDADLKKKMQGGTSGELVIRRGIPADKIARISCASEEGTTGRKAVIKKLKEAGITEFNGVPIEDFVVVAKTRGEMYQKYIKPAGY